MVDVFISYRRSQRAKVEPIKERLEALGLEVFFDVQSIDGGADFPGAINDTLRASKTVLACWSDVYFKRRPWPDWCAVECDFGLRNGLLIPVVIEPFNVDVQPIEFHRINYFDLSDWSGEQEHEAWRRTLNELSRRLGRELLARSKDPPQDGSVFIVRGNAHLEQDEYEAAVASFSEAIRLNPDDEWAFYNRGRAYAGLEDYARAIEDFNKVIRLNPEDEWALYNRGLAYLNLEDYARAIDDLHESIRLNPEIAEEAETAIVAAFLGSGDAHFGQGEYEAAIEHYTEIIDVSPDALYNCGRARYELGDYARAIDDFREAMRLKPGMTERANPSLAKALVHRGDDSLELEEFAAAIADYGEAVRLNPNNAWTFIRRGDALIRQEQYAAAIADYTEAIRLDPDEEWAFIGRGDAYTEQEHYESAIADYTEAIRINSTEEWALYSRGEAFVRLQDYDRALEDFSAAGRLSSEIVEEVNTATATALIGRGRRHLEQGNYHAAKADLELAARRSPALAAESRVDFERAFKLSATLPKVTTTKSPK